MTCGGVDHNVIGPHNLHVQPTHPFSVRGAASASASIADHIAHGPENRTPGTASHAKVAGIDAAERFCPHCPLHTAGRARHPFHMLKSTLGCWDLPSAEIVQWQPMRSWPPSSSSSTPWPRCAGRARRRHQTLVGAWARSADRQRRPAAWAHADSMADAVSGADATLLLTEWQEFRDADPEELAKLVARRNIVDGRNSLDADHWQAIGWTYRALGRPG